MESFTWSKLFWGNWSQILHLTCNLVNIFACPLNATILVVSLYSRSQAARSLKYVTPNEQIYNYETNARKYWNRFYFWINF